jgi:hypothetical protein
MPAPAPASRTSPQPRCVLIAAAVFVAYIVCLEYCIRKVPTPLSEALSPFVFLVFPHGYLPEDTELELPGGSGWDAGGLEIILGILLNVLLWALLAALLGYACDRAIVRLESRVRPGAS